MNNYTLKIKKVLGLMLVVIALFFSVGIPHVDAQLTVPTYDGPHIFTAIGEWSLGKMADIALEAGRISMDSAAYALGQMLLNQVTDNVVGWVKGGFNGSPSFAVDPTKLFLDASKMVASGLTQDILSLSVCDFDSLSRLNLAQSVTLAPIRNKARFADEIRCPFGGNDAQLFYNDFSKGGWRAFESSLSDRGNPFGTSLIVGQELSARQEVMKNTKEQELSWGGGFLSMADTSKCAYPEGMDPDFNDFTGLDRTPAEKSTLQNTYCQKTTPGKIVGEKLHDALNIDMDRLGFVDNINKILGAVINQLSGQAMQGIFGQDSSGANSGPAYVSTIQNAVLIGVTNGDKVPEILAGSTNQFINKIPCTGFSVCSAFMITLSGGTGTLTSIKITETGGVNANTDLSNVALFYNTSGSYSSGVTQFGGVVPNFTPAETATITGSLPLTRGTPYYFYVRLDTKSLTSATTPATMPTIGQTIGFQIAANPDVVVTGGASTTGAPKSLAGLTTFN